MSAPRCMPERPRVSAELPETGERFEGLAAAGRRRAGLRHPQARRRGVHPRRLCRRRHHDGRPGGRCCARPSPTRKNILVAGGTSTGKTTLANALLAEVAKTADRVVLIEDTRELQCRAPNLVALRTKDGVASLSDLVRSSLRLRPDRIPIGEVRGAEALDLLKAWGTGHPGGIGTIHAGSALGALRRLEQLIQEAVVTVPRALIAETIDLIAVLAAAAPNAASSELAIVAGLDPATGDYRVLSAGAGGDPMLPGDRHDPFHCRRPPCPSAPRRPCLHHRHLRWPSRRRPMPPARPCPGRQPLNQILQSVQGPVAKIIAVIIIIVTGLTLAFGDTSGGFRRLIQIVFGLSIAFAASSFFLSFFSFCGGALV